MVSHLNKAEREARSAKRQYIRFALCALRSALFIHLCLLPSLTPASPLHIRTITIEGNTRTRTEVIQHELLFQPNESLDTLKIFETERNLRRLFFLGDVRIEVQRDSTHANIIVHVRDLYARALSPLLSGESEELSYGLVALDFNFLGRGQVLAITGNHDAITGNSATVHYQNSRLNSSRKSLTSRFGIAEEGHDLRLVIAQPFYTLDTPWAYGIGINSREQIRRRYTNQTLSDRYTDRTDTGDLWIFYSAGNTFKIRPHAILNIDDQQFDPTTGYTYAPKDRQRVSLTFGLSLWQPRFEQKQFIRGLGRTEDLQIGSSASIRIGLSHKTLGSDRNFLYTTFQLNPRFKLHENTYTFLNLFFRSSYTQKATFDRFFQADLLTISQIHQAHTFALHARFDVHSNPEDNDQLLLGVNQGLRGYLPRRFDGTRRAILNLEARPTFYRHPIAILAGALFLDAGTAWTPGRTSPSLNLGAGLGTRISFTQVYNNPILRTDLAYGFKDHAWQLSFSIGHYF